MYLLSLTLGSRATGGAGPVAYGDRALPRLLRELVAAEPETRLQAMSVLCDLLHDPLFVSQAVNGGCLEQMKVLLQDPDVLIRTRTAESLGVMATNCHGREALRGPEVLSCLSELLQEEEVICRRNVHTVLYKLALFDPEGPACLLPLVPRLLANVQAEQDEEVLFLLLTTVGRSVCLDASLALASGGVAVVRPLLTHPCTRVRRAAASIMQGLSVPAEGKAQMCEQDVLPVLVGLLTDPDVQASAAGAIMNTTVIATGKYRALAAGALHALLPLLGSRSVCVHANTLQCLTHLAETRTGRQELLPHLPLVRGAGGEEEGLRRAIATAVEVISWTP